MTTTTILTVTTDRVHDDVCASVRIVAPGASVERVDPALIRRLPQAAALVVGEAEHARLARATGFNGGIVVVGTPAAEGDTAAFRAEGTAFVAPDATPSALGDALAAAVAECEHDGAPELRIALARARRMMAAGQIAFGLQHAFNNPLSALMAEAQLLQMDAPNDEVRQCADRMVQLVRRLTELSRSLDAVRDRPG
ncbi:MAG TPA: histidine kinase dimerization/phospho-acceptor domain-containing protein [Gemmatimonadaceae bacterium]|nr:histidine kinase dimerization/phospho-acceptor domain-containing protein [Gemmatimonadaceae bacterium]